ncbi:Uncharacterised protein [Mycobacteroides abscessus subsp. abscessus]|nr:Uncharacterised protein [Mycobacteroides abscessus subsp. abscessus]
MTGRLAIRESSSLLRRSCDSWVSQVTWVSVIGHSFVLSAPRQCLNRGTVPNRDTWTAVNAWFAHMLHARTCLVMSHAVARVGLL